MLDMAGDKRFRKKTKASSRYPPRRCSGQWAARAYLEVGEELLAGDVVQPVRIVVEAVDEAAEGQTDALDALLVVLRQPRGQRRQRLAHKVQLVGVQVLLAVNNDRHWFLFFSTSRLFHQ